MSSRKSWFSKAVGPPKAAEQLDSDDDYGPGAAQHQAKNAASSSYSYKGYAVSSDTEQGYSERSDSEQEHAGAVHKKTVQKKKHLKKKPKTLFAVGQPQFQFLLDDVNRSLQEVNALLAAPLPPGPPPKPVPWAYRVLRVDAKHLSVYNDIRQYFLPDGVYRGRHQPNRQLLHRRILVHPNKETVLYDYKMPGLSMAKYREVNDRMYFIFNHSEDYQNMHRKFLSTYPPAQPTTLLLYLDRARKRMHVEALLEIADILLRMKEIAVGNEIIENVVTFLQYVAHPLFKLTATNVRLEYKYLENRPFHVVMLKYICILMNKACYRTALEIAKMLLLLDPSDPLALLNILDVLALGAREYEWLINSMKYFDKQREAGLLYNIKYSVALSYYHIAMNTSQDLVEADDQIKDAILAHPQVLVKIYECLNVPNVFIYKHVIFAKDSVHIGTPGLNELFNIYAQLTSSFWRERGVVSWLVRNTKELVESYNRCSRVRAEAKNYVRMRQGLFLVWPPEYLRHIAVLNCVSKLVLDGPLTAFYRPSCGWDPLFDKGINRYEYKYRHGPPRRVGGSEVPLYSYDIRKDYMIMLSQKSNQTCMPFLSLHATSDTSMPVMPGNDPDWPALGAGSDHDEPYDGFPNYDYEDDAHSFEQYDREMATLADFSEHLHFVEDSDSDS
ncbi:unnamed protein product [Chrysodeixis includens]|uniref:Transcription factor 25 n=1 Tax=Chrysodeixis includens TaxID=689277 RepID=A0A9P0FPA0_CHRIL|nr:unnamed protein product [Chrysodeixis includens]